MQLDTGPLEAALLQHVARGWIQDARTRDQTLDGIFFKRIIDHSPRRFRRVAFAPVINAEAITKLRRVFYLPS